MPLPDPDDVETLAETLCHALKYELRYQKEGAAWEILIENGRPAPDWWTDCPELMAHEAIYLEGFWQLSTERQQGMSVGPIPWSSIQSYGVAKGLDSATMGLFHAVIRAMDGVYLEWAIAEQKKRAPKPPPTGKRSGRQKRPKR